MGVGQSTDTNDAAICFMSRQEPMNARIDCLFLYSLSAYLCSNIFFCSFIGFFSCTYMSNHLFNQSVPLLERDILIRLDVQMAYERMDAVHVY